MVFLDVFQPSPDEINHKLVMQFDYDSGQHVLFHAIEKKKWVEVDRILLLRERRARAYGTTWPLPKLLARTWVYRRSPSNGQIFLWRITCLHAAVIYGAPVDILHKLLEAYPDAAKMRDDQGNLPLHLAYKNGLLAEKMTLLIGAYPEGAKVKNRKGLQPIKCAVFCKRKEGASEKTRDERRKTDRTRANKSKFCSEDKAVPTAVSTEGEADLRKEDNKSPTINTAISKEEGDGMLLCPALTEFLESSFMKAERDIQTGGSILTLDTASSKEDGDGMPSCPALTGFWEAPFMKAEEEDFQPTEEEDIIQPAEDEDIQPAVDEAHLHKNNLTVIMSTEEDEAFLNRTMAVVGESANKAAEGILHAVNVWGKFKMLTEVKEEREAVVTTEQVESITEDDDTAGSSILLDESPPIDTAISKEEGDGMLSCSALTEFWKAPFMKAAEEDIQPAGEENIKVKEECETVEAIKPAEEDIQPAVDAEEGEMVQTIKDEAPLHEDDDPAVTLNEDEASLNKVIQPTEEEDIQPAVDAQSKFKKLPERKEEQLMAPIMKDESRLLKDEPVVILNEDEASLNKAMVSSQRASTSNAPAEEDIQLAVVVQSKVNTLLPAEVKEEREIVRTTKRGGELTTRDALADKDILEPEKEVLADENDDDIRLNDYYVETNDRLCSCDCSCISDEMPPSSTSPGVNCGRATQRYGSRFRQFKWSTKFKPPVIFPSAD